MTYAAIIILAVICLLLVGYGLDKSANTSAETSIEKWAKANQFEITSIERRFLLRGPYTFRATFAQAVYLVKYKSGSGKIAEVYICIGDVLFGRLADGFAVWPKTPR